MIEASAADEDLASPRAGDAETGTAAQSGSVTAGEEAGSRDGGEESEMIDAAIVEAAVTPEFEVLEEFSKEGLETVEELSREGLEAAELATGSFAEALRKLTAETADYSKKSFDKGSAFFGELRQAKSLPTAFQIQASYARSACICFLKHLSEMNALYWNLVKEASKLASKPAGQAEA
jgi:hypothetical protein